MIDSNITNSEIFEELLSGSSLISRRHAYYWFESAIVQL